MDRTEERTGPEDVGDQTLVRGLVPAFPLMRLGLSLSKRIRAIGTACLTLGR